MKYQNVQLFVIDGQNDFCADGSEPKNWPQPYGGTRAGSLCVTGASEEANRVGKMITDSIEGNKSLFSQIHATLDSHHRNDCSFNTSWRDSHGNIPSPFTIVTANDVEHHKFTPAFAKGYWHGKVISPHEWAIKYTKELESNGRNLMCLWPVHCEIGKWGVNPYHSLQNAYDAWADKTGRFIDFVVKGQWPYSEHYSPWQADVIDPTRQETAINGATLKNTESADLIVWCGWAGSHCLRWAGIDGVNFFEPSDSEKSMGKVNEYVKKCVFLSDASASVPNPPGGPDFESWRVQFLDEMSNRGAKILTCDELLKVLKNG